MGTVQEMECTHIYYVACKALEVAFCFLLPAVASLISGKQAVAVLTF